MAMRLTPGRYHLESGHVMLTTQTGQADVEAMARWLGDRTMMEPLGRLPSVVQPRDLAMTIAMFDRVVHHHFAIRATTGTRPIGFASVVVDAANESCLLSVNVCETDPDARRAEQPALRALLDWAFGVMGAGKAMLDVAASRPDADWPATCMRHESTAREALLTSGGSRVDLLRYGITKDDWTQARAGVDAAVARNVEAAERPLPTGAAVPQPPMKRVATPRLRAGPYVLGGAMTHDVLMAVERWMGNARLQRALGRDPRPAREGEAAAYVKSFDSHTSYLLPIRMNETGRPVGLVTLRREPIHGNGALTFIIAESGVPRRPALRQILKVVADWAYAEAGVHRLHAETLADNRVLAEVLGAFITHEGTLVGEVLRDGTRHDMLCYSVLATEWPVVGPRLSAADAE